MGGWGQWMVVCTVELVDGTVVEAIVKSVRVARCSDGKGVECG